MMLDYYDHTLDREFLRRTALPFSREILTFFDQHYPTNAQGKLVMHPSQAVETWWSHQRHAGTRGLHRCHRTSPGHAGETHAG